LKDASELLVFSQHGFHRSLEFAPCFGQAVCSNWTASGTLPEEQEKLRSLCDEMPEMFLTIKWWMRETRETQVWGLETNRVE
jgi:hypothetical protein